GRAPVWPSLTERYQVSGGIVTSSDLHRGIGMCVGLDAVEPSSLREADGPEFISYGEAALQELGKKDLVYVHAAMPDDALHASEPKAKADITDAFDQQVVGRILDRVSQLGPSRILLVCDPPRSAGKEPSGHVYIPYAFGEWPATQRIGGTGFNEADVKSGSVSPRDATKFLAVLLSRKA
ncbi:MAG: hypothetical protein ACT4OO_02255, partial [Nitrospiraceae bacterium]